MQRKLMQKLTQHFEFNNSRILVITGARGVGKTYLVNNFAKEYFESNLYFNFEHDASFSSLFEEDGNVIKTQQNINNYFETEVDYNNTVLILDEFTLCHQVINFLKACKDNFLLKIICAVSDNNIYNPNIYDNEHSLKIADSKVFQIIKLYPLDFEEFLWATNNEWYAESIKEHFKTNKPLPDIVHNNLLDLFNLYMYIGGMPDAINEYLHTNSLVNITERHSIIISKHLTDLKIILNDGDYIKTTNVYNSITNQLNKQNRKFQYSLLRKGATKKLYNDNIDYLCNSGYAIKCKRLYDYDESFKLYSNDVGLLNSLSHNNTDEFFINGLIENYVLQNLLANDNEVFFWESKSQAKIDFVARKNHKLYAIEVRNSTETRSKNYSIFKQTIRNNEGLIKISAKNFSYSKGVKFLPLYAVFCI